MNDFYEKLDELYASGDLEAVESLMLDVISGTGENTPERAGLYNELAGFYRGVSRYAESEDMFTRALEVFESIGMGATPEYATVLLNLAGLYRIMGDADKAIDLFHISKNKLENADARDSYAYVSVLNNLALAYQVKGELDPALELAEMALEIMRAAGGENDHEVASSLNNIASIRFQLGELDAADMLISEAMEIYDTMETPNVHHAAALATMSAVKCQKGDYNGSLQGFQRALELTKHFFGENIEFAICKRNISEVFELIGDVASATSELADAERILENLLGTEHSATINARNKLMQLRAGEKR